MDEALVTRGIIVLMDKMGKMVGPDSSKKTGPNELGGKPGISSAKHGCIAGIV